MTMKPEGPIDGLLQQYAFADYDQRSPEIPKEKNTPEEDELLDALATHFHSNEHISPKDANTIEQFLKDEVYSAIFHEPNVKKVYRGMIVPNEFITRAFNIDASADVSDDIIDGHFTFTPNEDIGATSWTTSIDIAQQYAIKSKVHVASPKSGIIMVANVADNPYKFIAGEGGLYDVRSFAPYVYEKEVLALGAIKVHRVYLGASIYF